MLRMVAATTAAWPLVTLAVIPEHGVDAAALPARAGEHLAVAVGGHPGGDHHRARHDAAIDERLDGGRIPDA